MSYLPEVGSALVEAFNKQWPPGTPCTVVKDLGQAIETRTRSHAWTLGHGQAVVLVEGISGGYALERVIPHRSVESLAEPRASCSSCGGQLVQAVRIVCGRCYEPAVICKCPRSA